MAVWIDAYDANGITADEPPLAAQRIADASALLLSSPMPRAVESARRLSRGRAVEIVPQAREAALPVAALTGPALPPALWLTAFRLGWFLGWRGGVEPVRAARLRGEETARLLAARARDGGSVCLVGHGILNAFVAGALRRDGWSGPRIPVRGPWSVGVYTR